MLKRNLSRSIWVHRFMEWVWMHVSIFFSYFYKRFSFAILTFGVIKQTNKKCEFYLSKAVYNTFNKYKQTLIHFLNREDTLKKFLMIMSLNIWDFCLHTVYIYLPFRYYNMLPWKLFAQYEIWYRVQQLNWIYGKILTLLCSVWLLLFIILVCAKKTSFSTT